MHPYLIISFSVLHNILEDLGVMLIKALKEGIYLDKCINTLRPLTHILH